MMVKFCWDHMILVVSVLCLVDLLLKGSGHHGLQTGSILVEASWLPIGSNKGSGAPGNTYFDRFPRVYGDGFVGEENPSRPIPITSLDRKQFLKKVSPMVRPLDSKESGSAVGSKPRRLWFTHSRPVKSSTEMPSTLVRSDDPFLQWLLNEADATGSAPINTADRLKPFYAADFGHSSDLPKNEYPKIVIVRRSLKVSSDGILQQPSSQSIPFTDGTIKDSLDVEVREVWQPWLLRKCDFAVRYIVPFRPNILHALSQNGQYSSELIRRTDGSGELTLKFKPTWYQRLFGHHTKIIRLPLDQSK